MRPGEHEAAWKRGDKTYHGAPCARCGGTEKYTSNCGCVLCKRKASSWQREVFKQERIRRGEVVRSYNKQPKGDR